MAGPAVGAVAPEFELPKSGGGSLKLSDLGGTPVVLFFYPKDDTSACTAEAIDFLDAAAGIRARRRDCRRRFS